jgi:hypothetical protein
LAVRKKNSRGYTKRKIVAMQHNRTIYQFEYCLVERTIEAISDDIWPALSLLVIMVAAF